MFNPMERIRKLSGMPDSMKRGYPPPSHRKCSDWASYIDAVDTVTRELVDTIITCQQSGLKIATDKAIFAGKLAEIEERNHKAETRRALAEVDRVAISNEIPAGVRGELAEAVVGLNN